jgi:hypothetical protein
MKNRNRSRKAFLAPARHPTLGGEPNTAKKTTQNQCTARGKIGTKDPQKRDFRLPANLPAGIVPDKQWPGMMPPS